jgi:two-component system chemotaxis sensor kinase CheA
MSVEPELEVFVEECDELLADMESTLLRCEKNEPSGDDINAIFRAAHTIKGSAGLFGLDFIVEFVHEVETVLDRVRIGSARMSQPLAVALLACGDHIRSLVGVLKQGRREGDAGFSARGHELVKQIRDLTGAAAPASTPQAESNLAAPPAAATRSEVRGEPVATDDWFLAIRFGADVFRNGMDPLSFLRYLATFGKLEKVIPRSAALRAGSEWDPESCHLGFDVRYHSDADRARIVDAFEFVREDCLLEVIEPRSAAIDYLTALDRVDGEAANTSHLVEAGVLTSAELAAATAAIPATETADAPLRKEEAGAAAKRNETASTEARSIRIDATKLDGLINLVGELIIAAAGTQLGARRAQDPELLESASQLATLVEQVRDSALQLRMVRIGATFSRFHRVVNDTARELGKNIRLSISGEDTELDKTVVEKIGDPLTHLIRNAIDHGIPKPEQRLAQGKPAEGTVSLNAYHDSGHIVIEVSDDGQGLNRPRILAKAIERGLVPAGAQLSEKEIDALIFEPGFSTAEAITNVSGRGVGMDVVKRNIAALRGTVEVRSVPGSGTTFVIRLPLTLAIINGFQVSVGKTVFVLPLEMVDECIEYTNESGHDYANVRNKALPFIRLHELLSLEPREGTRQNIVIVKSAGQRAGLVVDSLLGECQTVIKPLSKIFNRAKCVSGSSILGTGEVALILDVPALVQQAITGAGSLDPVRVEAGKPAVIVH